MGHPWFPPGQFPPTHGGFHNNPYHHNYANAMIVAQIVETSQGQTVRLPDEFRFGTRVVSIRRVGDAIVRDPVKPATWPEGFFESIRIDDPAFTRLEQGPTPPAPSGR
jgi:virulence-associated protein VagC